MTGLLESGVRKPFICLGPTTEVSPHSAGNEEVPRVWPFNATDKLDPDIRELLSMHCSWCVLDCGEAQMAAVHQPSHIRQPLPPSPCRISSAFRSCSGMSDPSFVEVAFRSPAMELEGTLFVPKAEVIAILKTDDPSDLPKIGYRPALANTTR